MADLVDGTPVHPTYPTLEDLEAPMPDIREMKVLPMCDCGLPAKEPKRA
ncbi:hypothetical protein LINPERHAP2_LOCUS21170 [Linum perenne]